MSEQELQGQQTVQPASLDPTEPAPLVIPIARPISLTPEERLAWPLVPPIVPQPLPPAPPPLPRIWTVFAMYLLAYVAALTVSTVYILGFTASGKKWMKSPSRLGEELLEELARTPTTMLAMLAFTLMAVFLLVMLGTMMSRVPWRQRLRLTAPPMTAGQLLVGAVGGISIGAVFTLVDALGFLPRSATLEPLGQAMAGLRRQDLIWGVLVIGIMPGIAEEFLFRGYIQTRLSQRWRIGWSVFATALMFAVYHMDFSQGLLALAVGVYLGWLTERAGSIVPAMVAHSANNTVAVLASSFAPAPESELICWVLLVAAMIVACGCVLRLRRVGQKRCPQTTQIEAADQNKSSTTDYTDVHG